MKMFNSLRNLIFGQDWQKTADLVITQVEQKMQELAVIDRVTLDDTLKNFLKETLGEELKKQSLNNLIKDIKNLEDSLAEKINSELLANKKALEKRDINLEVNVRDILQHIAESASIIINTSLLVHEVPSPPPPQPSILQVRDLPASTITPTNPPEKIENKAASMPALDPQLLIDPIAQPSSSSESEADVQTKNAVQNKE